MTRSTTRYSRHHGKDIVHNGVLPTILPPLRYYPHCFTVPSAEKISFEKKYLLQHDGYYATPIVLSSAGSNDLLGPYLDLIYDMNNCKHLRSLI